jgi:ABC-type xylose transport system permease subunit
MGWLIHALAMPAFIVTLAGMFLARGAAYMLTIDSDRHQPSLHLVTCRTPTG